MTKRHFHSLTLARKIPRTELACTLELEVPPDLKDIYAFKAGQYLTFKVNLNGEELRRSYSINSSPVTEEPLQVTVKKVKGGQVSNNFVDDLKEGETLSVMPPVGQFVLPDFYPHKFYFYAAGSGITPILGLIKTILLTDRTALVNLQYGNYDREHVIFFDELMELSSYYNERFTITHHYTDGKIVKPKRSLFEKIFDITHPESSADAFVPGDFTVEKLLALFNEHDDFLSSDHYICGPGQMIPELEQALKSVGVSQNQIHHEYFAAEDAPRKVESISDASETLEQTDITVTKLSVTLDGETSTFNLPAGETVLRASIEEGLSVPYACESGVCATCKAKCLKGKVKMRSNSVLSDNELAMGYILTCQSEALTDELEVDYDAV